MHVIISFEKMRADAASRRRGDGGDFAKGDYHGEVTTTTLDTHFTKLFLKSTRGEAKAILASARAIRATTDSPSLYGMTTAAVATALIDPPPDSWSSFDRYSETMLQVALNVPVRYHDTWLPGELRATVRDIETSVAALNFAVIYDGTELRKPVMLGAYGKTAFVSRFSFHGDAVSATGYFYVQHGALRPQDLNGVLIRIRNAAVGAYDATFLSFPTSEGTLFQRWISAEIWADDRLEDAMNIDRRTLREAHPAFVELQSAIHNHLSLVLKQARSELYQASSIERKATSAKESAASVSATLSEYVKPHAATAARSLSSSVSRAARTPEGTRWLTRKYTVGDLFRIVAEVAHDILTPTQLARFMDRLTKRLSE